MSACWRIAVLCAAALACASDVSASTLDKSELQRVWIDQRIGNQLDLSLPFAEDGQPATLDRYFGPRPVVLALVYNRCPMLCNQVLAGLVGALKVLDETPGSDFDVLAVSFDPEEEPRMAAAARATLLRRYGRPEAEGGIHFLTGARAPIASLTDAVGFRYQYDEALDQYAHPSALIVLTPGGKVARYFFGTEYSPRDLRLALHEASEGAVGSLTDDLLLLCYRYDPASGTYSATIVNAIRAGGIATVLALGLFMGRSLRRDRRRTKAVASTKEAP